MTAVRCAGNVGPNGVGGVAGCSGRCAGDGAGAGGQTEAGWEGRRDLAGSASNSGRRHDARIEIGISAVVVVGYGGRARAIGRIVEIPVVANLTVCSIPPALELSIVQLRTGVLSTCRKRNGRSSRPKSDGCGLNR